MGRQRIADHYRRRRKRVRDFFRLYTSGMNRREIERLLKKDTLEALSYYREKTPPREERPARRGLRARLGALREIFVSFLMQLTPARRLLYGIGLVGFFAGLLWAKNLWVAGGFAIVNLLLALELADKLTARDELEIAREIQVSLEPAQAPETPWLSVAFCSAPARIVGGDFFNAVPCGDGRLLSIVGDVSGKGIPAALYAAHLQSMFESLAAKSASPAGILGELNRLICRRLREGDFITAVVAAFEEQQRSLLIGRAGHNWPLFYCAGTGRVEPLKTRGLCLGADAEAGFAACLEEKRLPLDRGDVLLLYSDGVTEAMDAAHRRFEQQRLEAALAESAALPAGQIVQHINQRLAEFVRDEEPHDDATLLAIKVK